MGETENKNDALMSTDDVFSEESNDNIFDELGGDLDFGEDAEDQNVGNEKDPLQVYKITGTILLYINMLFFTIVGLGISYLYIQKDPSFIEEPFLDDVCNIFLGEKIKSKVITCSSISGLEFKVNTETVELEKEIFQKLVKLIPDVYQLDNFLYSKEVLFLLSQSTDRLKPLKILTEFNQLKNTYTGIDRKKIICNGLEFKQGNVLTMSCEAFTSDWETIIGESGEKGAGEIKGTSISLAASFINYISKKSVNFKILDKQKDFTISSVTGIGGYTKSTPFSLELEYVESLEL